MHRRVDPERAPTGRVVVQFDYHDDRAHDDLADLRPRRAVGVHEPPRVRPRPRRHDRLGVDDARVLRHRRARAPHGPPGACASTACRRSSRVPDVVPVEPVPPRGPTAGRPERRRDYNAAAATTTTDGHRPSAGVRSRRAAREVPRRARQAPARPTATTSTSRSSARFAHYVDDPYVEPIEREPLTDEVDVVVVGGGFGGLLAGARLREAGIERHPARREGRRLRRHVVLEPLPGRDVRRRVVHLPAAARGDRLRPEGEVPRAPEILAHSRAIGRALRPLRRRPVPDRGHRDALGRGRRPLARRRRTAATRMRARFVCMANGPLHRPKLPAIPGIERFAGHSFHTSRWDYDYTGGDSDGNLTGLRRQARRHHRHRRDRRAVRAPPRRGGRAAVRVPAHAVVDRRARQPADRSGVGGEPASRAGSSGGWRTSTTSCPACFEPEDLVNDGWTDIIGKLLRDAARGRRAPTSARTASPGPSSWPTSRRWSRSAPASTRSSTTRRRPRR